MSELGNGEIFVRYADLRILSCMRQFSEDGGIAFPGIAFRATMAEALIRRDFRANGPVDFVTVQPLWHQPTLYAPAPDELLRLPQSRRVEAQRTESSTRGIEALSRLGECVARRAPESVRIIMMTAAGSSTEREQLQAMTSHVSACLEAGQTVRLDLSNLRATLAYNYYRLAALASPPMQGTP